MFADLGLTLILLVLVGCASRPLYRFFLFAGTPFRWVGRRPRLSVAFVGVVALVLNAGLSTFVRMPEPFCTDEYAQLLCADTFAHGRLTNPTPPFRDHFWAPELLTNPTFQSKYPPAQSAVLAFGQVTTGRPIVGVWLSFAIACAAVCWMLQAWVPSGWAFVGGLLTTFNPWLVSLWGQSYWGGAVALAGGALLFGSFRRILDSQRPRDALLLVLGLGLLANSRPYEGLVTSLPVAAFLGVWFVTGTRTRRGMIFLRVVLPFTLGMTAIFGWMAYYNFHVTGDPLRMPYQAWHEESGPGRRVGAYLSPFRSWEPDSLREEFVLRGRRLFSLWIGHLKVPLTIPLLFLPWAMRDRWTQFAVFCVLLVLGAIMLEMTQTFLHYAAPVTGLVMLLVVQGLRRMRTFGPADRPRGRVAAAGLVVLYVGFSMSFLLQGGAWQPKPDGPPTRTRFDRALEAAEGNHLVFVRDTRQWADRPTDWVYNRADLDGAKVIWARDKGVAANREVILHYTGRRVWLLAADLDPPRLFPYPSLR